MAYVDGFLAAVPTANRDTFKRYAEALGVIMKAHGAVQLVDCWGDNVPDGEVTSFPMAVKCRDDEAVVFGWIVWPSREARETGMQNAMADPRMQPYIQDLPFDGKRMVFGGFEMLVEA